MTPPATTGRDTDVRDMVEVMVGTMVGTMVNVVNGPPDELEAAEEKTTDATWAEDGAEMTVGVETLTRVFNATDG